MSGGSFNYLYVKDSGDLFRSENREDLRSMADTLTSMGFHDAAAATEDIIAYTDHALRQVEARRQLLSDVWHAAEWKCSGDYGIEQVRNAVDRYRKT